MLPESRKAKSGTQKQIGTRKEDSHLAVLFLCVFITFLYEWMF